MARITKAWITGPKGGRYYVTESGEKKYGKEAEEAARAEGVKGLAGPEKPDKAMGMLASAKQKFSALKARLLNPPAIKGQPKDAAKDAVPAGRKWVGHDDKICPPPEKGGTMAKYTTGSTFDASGEPIKVGEWSADRKSLHEAIIAHAMSGARTVGMDKRPVAILTMGGPASGKSSVLKAAKIDKGAFVHVDADGIKEMLPEYQEMTDMTGARGTSIKSAARAAHEESSHLAKEIRNAAISGRKNLIVDGTGKNDKAYIKLINDLKAKGYAVKVIMCDLDVETGLKRAALRAERTGRWVPEDFTRDAYNTIPKNFEKIAKQADTFMLYNNHGKEAIPVWTNLNGMEMVHDPVYKEKFDKGEPRSELSARIDVGKKIMGGGEAGERYERFAKRLAAKEK